MKDMKYIKKCILNLIGIMVALCVMFGMDETTVEAAEQIEISTSEQLSAIGTVDTYPLDGDYVLTCDVDMAGVKHTPIGTVEKPFTGTFDGAGYTIKNLSIQGLEVGALAGLSDKSIICYGLFGVVKNADNDDLAYIKNVNLSNASVNNNKATNTAAGILVGIVYNGVAIENVAVLDARIELKATSGSVLYGAGHLVGVSWAGKGQALEVKSQVSDVYTSGSIHITGYSEQNTVSGVIGCVYNVSIGSMTRVVSLGQVTYGDENGYGLATSKKYDGNGIVDSVRRAYYATEDNRADNGIGNGISKGVMASGKVALGDKWYQVQGVLPVMSQAQKIQSLSSVIYVNHKRNQSLNGILGDFNVATEYDGNAVVWTSSSSSIQIDAASGVASVSVTDGVAESVTLSYVCGSISGSIKVSLGEAKDITFNTQYVKPGETLKILYAPKGATYKWEILNKGTGKTRNWEDTTGEYIVTDEDLESFITVTVNGKTKKTIYVSTLPIVYIDSTKGFSGLSKTNYYNGTIRLAGDRAEYAPWELYAGPTEFKGRGHSSSYYEKVGLKLKLAEKSDMYGMSGYENKHWVLVSNVLDGTFMRNSIVSLFASYMKKNSVMDYTDVILIYNGDYKGVYQLYEHVRIDEGRVEVFDFDEYAKDIAKTIAKAMVKSGELSAHYEQEYADGLQEKLESDYSYMDTGYVEYEGKKHEFANYGIETVEPTGGYLVVMDRHSIDNKYKQATLHTAYKLPLYIDKPGTDEKSQLNSMKGSTLYNYAVKYNQSFEYALHSDDFFFRNEDKHYKVISEGAYVDNRWQGMVYQETTYTDDDNNGKHYSQMFDIDSLVRNFLVCEFSQNYDSMKNSFYYKKDIGQLAEVGPFWDYDWTLGNWITIRYTNMPTKWQTTLKGADELFYQHVSWNRMLIRDPYFLMKVWEQYTSLRPTIIEDIVKEGGFVDTQYERFKKVHLANDRKWGHLDVFMSYESGMNTLRNFLDKRIPWLDKQFATLDTLISSLGYYHASDYLEVNSVNINDDGSAHIEATVSKDTVAYVAFQVNGSYLITAPVENGTASIDVAADELTKDGKNIVEIKAMDINSEYMINTSYSDPGNYNLIHSNYYMFD